MVRTAILSDLPEIGTRCDTVYISACRLVSNTLPTAKLMFSRLSDLMTLLPMLPDVPGSQKTKMADGNPELPSRLVDKIATKFQRLQLCI